MYEKTLHEGEVILEVVDWQGVKNLKNSVWNLSCNILSQVKQVT